MISLLSSYHRKTNLMNNGKKGLLEHTDRWMNDCKISPFSLLTDVRLDQYGIAQSTSITRPRDCKVK